MKKGNPKGGMNAAARKVFEKLSPSRKIAVKASDRRAGDALLPLPPTPEGRAAYKAGLEKRLVDLRAGKVRGQQPGDVKQAEEQLQRLAEIRKLWVVKPYPHGAAKDHHAGDASPQFEAAKALSTKMIAAFAAYNAAPTNKYDVIKDKVTIAELKDMLRQYAALFVTVPVDERKALWIPIKGATYIKSFDAKRAAAHRAGDASDSSLERYATSVAWNVSDMNGKTARLATRDMRALQHAAATSTDALLASYCEAVVYSARDIGDKWCRVGTPEVKALRTALNKPAAKALDSAKRAADRRAGDTGAKVSAAEVQRQIDIFRNTCRKQGFDPKRVEQAIALLKSGPGNTQKAIEIIKGKDSAKALDAKRAAAHRALDSILDRAKGRDSAKGMTSAELRDEIRAVKAQISGGAGITLKREDPSRYAALEKRLTELLDAASYRVKGRDAEGASEKKEARVKLIKEWLKDPQLDFRSRVKLRAELEKLERGVAKDYASQSTYKPGDRVRFLDAWKNERHEGTVTAEANKKGQVAVRTPKGEALVHFSRLEQPKAKDAVAKDDYLSNACTQCDGTGRKMIAGQNRLCPSCNGSGRSKTNYMVIGSSLPRGVRGVKDAAPFTEQTWNSTSSVRLAVYLENARQDPKWGRVRWNEVPPAVREAVNAKLTSAKDSAPLRRTMPAVKIRDTALLRRYVPRKSA